MHPLVPDDFDIRSIADPHAHEAKEFLDLAGQQSRSMMEQFGAVDLFYALGTAHPGAVTLHNHPRFMQRFRRHDDMEIDLAAVDILRSRERGVPRYNQFRRLLHLPPAESFEDLTKDRDKAAEIAAVYGSIEDVDLTVGLHAEPLPSGFGFSDTAFRTFILMASRRLKGDRFFTTDCLHTRGHPLDRRQRHVRRPRPALPRPRAGVAHRPEPVRAVAGPRQAQAVS
jgi:hypothetical protein